MKKRVIAVSACLLGEACRYDGRAKPSPELIARGKTCAFLAICPERDAGFGVPRPPMNCFEEAEDVRARLIDTREDRTDAIRAFAARVCEEYELAAWIGQHRSPSCGICDTPLHAADLSVRGSCDGVFTAALRRHAPGCRIRTPEEFLAE